MARKMKEDEKMERAIRSLLKLPENRRCINCNSIGPQYVCTTFWTFICTNCSGIHREFTHRVKSVSMAKFTADEVSALHAGGNERARQIYFKEWDPHRNSQPDGSNPYKLRDFIKHVYVDRRFTGEEGTEKLPKLRLADKEYSSEIRRPISSRIGLSSPGHEDRYDWRYNSARSSPCGRSDDGITRYYYDESRSPRYTQQSSRSVGYRRSPARFEVVDDRFRDDEYGSRRRSSNTPRLMSEDFKFVGKRSPENLQKNAEKPAIPLEARLERERSWKSSQSAILRDRKVGKDAQGPSKVKKAPSPPRQSISRNGNKGKEERVANKDSLIGCKDHANPPDVQTQQQTPPPTTTALAIAAAATNEGTDWAPFESSMEEKKVQMRPSDPKTLEFLLFELSVPTALPGPSSNEMWSGIDQPSTSKENAAPTAEQHALETFSRLHERETVDTPRPECHPDASMQQPIEETSGGCALDNSPDLMQNPISHQYHWPPASAPEENLSPVEQPFSTEPATPLETKIQQQPSITPYPAQNVAETEPQAISLVAPKSPHLEREPNARKELPADLFTAQYSQAPAHIQGGWQPVPPQGFGFNTQYYPSHTMRLGPYSNSPKSTNPFDVGDEGTEPQGPLFPSMLSLQEALSNNMSAPSAPFSLCSCSSYMLPMQPESPQKPSFSPGLYVGQQQGHSNLPFPSLQQQHGFEDFSGNRNHQTMMGYPGTNTTSYSSSSSVGGGNPFS